MVNKTAKGKRSGSMVIGLEFRLKLEEESGCFTTFPKFKTLEKLTDKFHLSFIFPINK
jgi:hypothetical protein